MASHIYNLSDHRYIPGDDLMDKSIKVEVYFGNGNLNTIITQLINSKLSLWSVQNQEESENDNTDYTTVNHIRGVVAD